MCFVPSDKLSALSSVHDCHQQTCKSHLFTVIFFCHGHLDQQGNYWYMFLSVLKILWSLRSSVKEGVRQITKTKYLLSLFLFQILRWPLSMIRGEYRIALNKKYRHWLLTNNTYNTVSIEKLSLKLIASKITAKNLSD